METPYVGSSRDPPLAHLHSAGHFSGARYDFIDALVARLSPAHEMPRSAWTSRTVGFLCPWTITACDLPCKILMKQVLAISILGDVAKHWIKRTNPVPGTPSPTTDSRGWLQNVCAKERVVLGFSGHLVNYELCRQTPAPVAASNNNEVYIYVVSVLTTSQEYECWFVVLIILKNLKVNGKDYPIYYGKQNLETTNQ